MDDQPEFLTPATSCEAAFRQIARACATALDVAINQVMDDEDPQGPHRARVALRRLTTAMDAFSPILRRRRGGVVRRRAKQLFRILGELRDSDVHLEGRRSAAGHADRLRRNVAIRAHVRNALAKRHAAGFAAAILDMTGTDGKIWRRGAAARVLRQAPLSVFAARMLDAAWADCCAHGASVTAMTAEARHAFRKDLKAMRYLAEFFVALFPELGQDPFRVDFRDIQDALGALNDWQVALTLEGRDNAAMLPDHLIHAMAEAEVIWGRLGHMPLPWRQTAP